MIITCENCKTRFNLDENLIKESGSRVRCSRCHHIFTAYKPAPAEEPLPGAEPTHPFAEEEETRAKAAEISEDLPEEALDFQLFESEEEKVEAKDEISLEALDLEEEPAPEETPWPTEQVAEEEKVEAKDEISLEDIGFEEELAPEQVPEPPEEPALKEGLEEETALQDLSLEEAAAEETPPEEEVGAEEIAEVQEEASVALPEAMPVASLEEAEEAEAEQPQEAPIPPPITEKEPPARKPFSTPLLVLLVFVLVGGGAYAAYTVLKSLDIKIPFLESLTGAPKSQEIDPGNMDMTLLHQFITGEFVHNTTVGPLFVIKGKIRNDYPEARSFIRVKSLLYLKDGKIAKDRFSYCGNVLSDTDLQRLDTATIDNKLRNRFGDKKSNFRVPSGKVLPFMVVFSDLPQDLGEFSVEVVGSFPG